MIKRKIFKKAVSIAMSVAMVGAALFTGSTASAATSAPLMENETVASDAGYLKTFMASDYMKDGNTGFEIKFEYTELGTGFAEDNTIGYNNSLQFVVFDTSWGGWEPTVIGPNGYDKEAAVTPEENTEYTVKVPFSVIESKLSTGAQVQGINLQTGGVLGATIKINSLTYISEERVSSPVTIEGSWHKTGVDGDTEAQYGTMTVTEGTAYVSTNPWNIVVSGLDLDDFAAPIVAVTVEYGEITDGPIYPQSEVLDADYNPIEQNYPQVTEAGEVTYLTPLEKDMQTIILAYDTCTVKKVQIYNADESDATTVLDLTNDDIVKAMGAGWNLGNALDAVTEDGVTDETAWGNPEVEKYQYLFKLVSEAGFKTVRIPVSWVDGVTVNGNSYEITDKFDAILNKVQGVVDMARAYDLFVIIDIQHDGSEGVTGQWLDVDAPNQTGIRAAFNVVWGRIADRFQDYDQHLIFESMNEVMESGNYGTPSDTTWDNINTLNQTFVDSVRNKGGHNDVRFLLVPGYNTNIDQTVTDKFVLPKYGRNSKNIMVSVHFYDPYNFTLNTGDGSTTECTAAELAAIKTQFAKLKAKFVDKDIPVVIGEFSAANKGNIPQIKEYISTVVKDAQDNGLAYIYWDNGYTGENGMALWNRYTYAETDLGKALIPILTASKSAD